MRVLSFLLLLVFSIFPCGLAVENALPEETTGFLQQLSIKLDLAAARESNSFDQQKGSELYWKDNRPRPASLPEIKMLRGAVEEAKNGKSAEAVKSLNAFKEKYPDSPLRPDADAALKKLSAE
jgi:hypothetical protein